MNPYNHIGAHILAECADNKVTYKYACVNKMRPYILPTLQENILGIDPYSIDPKYQPGDPRRYGAA